MGRDGEKTKPIQTQTKPNKAKQSQFMLAPSTAVGLKKTQNNEKNR